MLALALWQRKVGVLQTLTSAVWRLGQTTPGRSARIALSHACHMKETHAAVLWAGLQDITGDLELYVDVAVVSQPASQPAASQQQ